MPSLKLSMQMCLPTEMSSGVLPGRQMLLLGCKSTRSPVSYLAILGISDSPGHLRPYQTPENHTPHTHPSEEFCREPVNMVYIFIRVTSSVGVRAAAERMASQLALA